MTQNLINSDGSPQLFGRGALAITPELMGDTLSKLYANIGKLEQTISVFFKSFDCYEVQRRAFKHLIFSLKNFKHKKD